MRSTVCLICRTEGRNYNLWAQHIVLNGEQRLPTVRRLFSSTAPTDSKLRRLGSSLRAHPRWHSDTQKTTRLTLDCRLKFPQVATDLAQGPLDVVGCSAHFADATIWIFVELESDTDGQTYLAYPLSAVPLLLKSRIRRLQAFKMRFLRHVDIHQTWCGWHYYYCSNRRERKFYRTGRAASEISNRWRHIHIPVLTVAIRPFV